MTLCCSSWTGYKTPFSIVRLRVGAIVSVGKIGEQANVGEIRGAATKTFFEGKRGGKPMDIKSLRKTSPTMMLRGFGKEMVATNKEGKQRR
ncbi:hypothetical protein CDL15_Pgr001016 [Punica granatum]|uniref:Uncharacterized protein n=1 Tax=Punica granatum TaxID=22663 RepID=A0A218VSD8_PUNGR|nr:hypothetical protein CDL15_Pgr001016 [Punica granatum]